MAVNNSKPEITLVDSVRNIGDGALLIHDLTEKAINEIQKKCADRISEYVEKYSSEYDHMREDTIDLLRHLDDLKKYFKEMTKNWLNTPDFSDAQDGSLSTTVGITTDIVARYQNILTLYRDIDDEIQTIERGLTKGSEKQRLFINM